MTNSNEKSQYQARLDEIQATYREWLALQPELEAAQQTIKQSTLLMKKMYDFYKADYRRLYEAHEAGIPLDLRTKGEYSVLSEDALWNAFHEHDEILWQLLHSSITALHESRKQGQEEE